MAPRRVPPSPVNKRASEVEHHPQRPYTTVAPSLRSQHAGSVSPSAMQSPCDKEKKRWGMYIADGAPGRESIISVQGHSAALRERTADSFQVVQSADAASSLPHSPAASFFEPRAAISRSGSSQSMWSKTTRSSSAGSIASFTAAGQFAAAERRASHAPEDGNSADGSNDDLLGLYLGIAASPSEAQTKTMGRKSNDGTEPVASSSANGSHLCYRDDESVFDKEIRHAETRRGWRRVHLTFERPRAVQVNKSAHSAL